MAIGGIGGMGRQNMGLTNLVGAPRVDTGMFGMSDSSRAMLARALMGMSMNQPMTHPLQGLGTVAAMWAAGKTATDADEAKEAGLLEKQEQERQAKLARQAQARSTLGSLGQTLYGGQGMEGFEGLIGEEDPYADLRSALTLRRGVETDRRRTAGGGRSGGGAAAGSALSVSLLAEARRIAESHPRWMDLTPQQQIAYQRDIAMGLSRGSDPTVDPESFFPAEPEAAPGFNLFRPSTWGFGGGQAPEPAAPAATPVPRGPTPPFPPQGGPAADPLAEARDAIARGADPQAVRQRLQQMGIDPGVL